jgi:sigma-B regulation protein RsbU (phosphoserine phosphatase)
MGMVPNNFPLVPGRTDFDCFGRLVPAKIVGGDLFDIFLLSDNLLFMSITDTLGKGIPAAMYSVMIRTFIRCIANPITRLGKMMESLNEALSLVHESDMFATVLLGKLDLETGDFVYCNAGHLHPVILRNSNRPEVLAHSHGIPVGVKRNLQYAESQTILAPGESLISFTDGVTEQCDEKGEFFGVERLISIVNSLRELSAEEIVNETLIVLERFRGLTDVHDDITLMALKFTRK